jgi:NAD/NADP transhydrogenase beta subunit
MESTYLDPMSPEEEAAAISKIAHEVNKRGLEVPVVFALESHKPLGRVMAHMSVATAPFLVPFVGMQNMENISRILCTQGSIDRLIEAIEQGARQTSETRN